jgi:hypothetical protein
VAVLLPICVHAWHPGSGSDSPRALRVLHSEPKPRQIRLLVKAESSCPLPLTHSNREANFLLLSWFISIGAKPNSGWALTLHDCVGHMEFTSEQRLIMKRKKRIFWEA